VEFAEPGLLAFSSVRIFGGSRDFTVTCVGPILSSRYSCDLFAIPGIPEIDTLDPGESIKVIVRMKVESVPGRFTDFTIAVSAPKFDPNPDNNEGSDDVFIATPSFDDSNKICFIATAAYGTPWQSRVVTLRHFRDQWLLTNTPGRAFVQWYYANSPPIADWIAERNWARAMVRGILTPVVIAIDNPGKAWVLIFGTAWLLVYWRRRRQMRCQ